MHDPANTATTTGVAGSRATRRTHRRGERGIAVAMTGLLLVPLLIFAAFGVDLASWYARISALQRAADAAALAGAVWMPEFSVASQRAEDSLRSNHLHPDFDSAISFRIEPGSTTSSLRVTVTDNDADRHFSSIFVDGPAVLERSAEAEYNLPIPLGSPLNYFGGDVTQVPDPPAIPSYTVEWPGNYNSRIPYDTTAAPPGGSTNPAVPPSIDCHITNNSSLLGRWAGGPPPTYRSNEFGTGNVCGWTVARTNASGTSNVPPPDYWLRPPTNIACRVRVNGTGATIGAWIGGPTRYANASAGGLPTSAASCTWTNSNTDTSPFASHPNGGTNALRTLRPQNGPCRVGYAPADGYWPISGSWVAGAPPFAGLAETSGNRLCMWSAEFTDTTTDPGPAIDPARSPGFWAAISGPGGVASQGQAYTARCTYSVNNCSVANRNTMYRTTGYWYVVRLPASGASSFTIRVFDASQRTGGSPSGDSRDGGDGSPYFNTTYRVYEQTNPLDINVRQPTPGQPANGNTTPGSCYWTLPGGSGSDSFTGQWTDLCTISGPSNGSLYLVNVLTHTSDSNGAGINGYAIEAVSASDPQPAIFAHSDMAMYNNLDAGNATFYLAEVGPQYAGKTLVIDLWDPGDADGVARMTPMMPSGSVPRPVVEVPASQCRYSADTPNPRHTSPPYGGSTSPGVTDTTPSGSTCTILTANQTNSSGTPRINLYNDEWLRIRVQIPATYTCTLGANPETTAGSCWWGIRYNFSHDTTDATTWAARIEGNPLQLIE